MDRDATYMTAWYLLAIPLGGFGAVARVFTTRLGERHVPGGAITMTALINIVGAGLIGVVAAVGNDVALLVLGGGLLGGLTTFSTWMVEVDTLHRRGLVAWAAAALVVPAVLGAAAYALTRSVF
ncbi:MAG: CrcB family protein [Actinobacteria bacterium]|nr:CrcB family protein [Actinomycetota bacterium]